MIVIGPGDFCPESYWDERLANHYSIGSVGWAGLGDSFNAWMYRVRWSVFRRAVTDAHGGPPPSSLRVLDIGSGTGFYIDAWKRLGVRDVVASDITATAVQQLADRYAGTRVHKLDISDPEVRVPGAPFDVVSIMDVLFHVVDDDRYAAALANIVSLLKPTGMVFLTENLMESRIAGRHQVHRSREEIQRAFAASGLQPIVERPMFCLMNAPVASSSRLLSVWWHWLTRVVRRNEMLGWFAGAALFPLEMTLLRTTSWAPSSKILICRRP